MAGMARALGFPEGSGYATYYGMEKRRAAIDWNMLDRGLVELVNALDVEDHATTLLSVRKFLKGELPDLPWSVAPPWKIGCSPVKKRGRPKGAKSVKESAMPRGKAVGFDKRIDWFIESFGMPWLKSLNGEASERGFARAIGQNPSVVHNWRNLGNTPDTDVILHFTSLIGMDDPAAATAWLETGHGAPPTKTGVVSSTPKDPPVVVVAERVVRQPQKEPSTTTLRLPDPPEGFQAAVQIAQELAGVSMLGAKLPEDKVKHLIGLVLSAASAASKRVPGLVLAAALGWASMGTAVASERGGTADARDLGSPDDERKRRKNKRVKKGVKLDKNQPVKQDNNILKFPNTSGLPINVDYSRTIQAEIEAPPVVGEVSSRPFARLKRLKRNL